MVIFRGTGVSTSTYGFFGRMKFNQNSTKGQRFVIGLRSHVHFFSGTLVIFCLNPRMHHFLILRNPVIECSHE